MPIILWNLTKLDVTPDEAKFLENEGIVYDTYSPEEGSTERPETVYCIVDDVHWDMVYQFLHDYRKENPTQGERT